MNQGIVFAERCPQCEQNQAQEGYTASDLMRLLNGGHPIEAYCVFCDEFWPVGPQKRVELKEIVAAVVATRPGEPIALHGEEAGRVPSGN